MKRFFKYLLYTIFTVFLLFQLYPKPKKNTSASTGPKDLTAVHKVPDDVLQVLKTSCYDCHSNNTNYPWYSSVQPVALWLGNHVDEGKAELNFSEFGNYSLRRQYRKLEEINKEVKENEMPLSSYTIIHRDAKLDDAKKLLLATWVSALSDSFKSNYPPDSLVKQK